MKIQPCWLFALAFLSALPVHAAPRYTVTSTGAFGTGYTGLYINQAGAVAGNTFLFSGGVLTNLTVPAGSYVEVGGINDSGVLTGTVYSGFAHAEPYIYSNGAMKSLGAMGQPTGYGYAINNHGTVVGMIDTSPYDYPNQYAFGFIYANGVMRGLPTLGGLRSAAYDINDAGVAVGNSDTGELGRGSAVRYENGAVTALGTLPGSPVSGANALNSQGDATGYSAVQLNGGYYDRAVIFSGGQVMDIGLLGSPSDSSVGYDINNWGEVVGTEKRQTGDSIGFLFADGKLLDLNALVDKPAGWTITAARGINDQHQIAAWGCDDAACQALLLSPAAIPEPQAWLLWLGGLGLIAGKCMRGRLIAGLRRQRAISLGWRLAFGPRTRFCSWIKPYSSASAVGGQPGT
jgi:probable HAF family extracellular repeat protein